MKGLSTTFKFMTRWALATLGCAICFIHTTKINSVEAAEGLGGPPHIGTFEGSTTFMTTSSNGINPGLYLEVMDQYGNYTEYMSEDGMITIQGTKEGAYVTQAKLLGKTKYMDQATGEILDEWEEGRDLTLVSSEGPGLITAGKNLISTLPTQTYAGLSFTKGDNNSEVIVDGTCIVDISDYYIATTNNDETKDLTYLLNNAPVGTKFFLSNNLDKKCYFGVVRKGDDSPTWINGDSGYIVQEGDENARAFVRFKKDEVYNHSKLEIQLEIGEAVTPYEPYQSNRLTIKENIELRGIGDIRDTLDLLTGEVVSNFSTYNFSDRDNWSINAEANSQRFTLKVSPSPVGSEYSNEECIISTNLPGVKWNQSWNTVNTISCNDNAIAVHLPLGVTIEQCKEFMRGSIAMYRNKRSTKTVSLNSTYYFDPVLNRDVRVDGTVLPLVASVTIPTEPLSFLLDPNQPSDQQFIAPQFSLTNHTPVSIYLNLKSFEQTTSVFNDVLPTKYADWSQLDKHQSKDIALALVPIPSAGWLSLDEGPRYVADTSNYELGEVKTESTVEFTFSALHGRAFLEQLNPKYRLAFEFGF